MTSYADLKTMLRVAGLVLIVAVGFVSGTSAQNESPPAGGTPKPFVFPAQESFTLQNGMMVTLVDYGSIPKVSFDLVIRTGTKDDAKGKMGISSIVGQMLKEGTTTRAAEAIARQAAEMGGSIEIDTGTDSTSISGEVLSEFDTQFLTLLGDVVMNPGFDEADFERLRADELRRLAVANAQPGTMGWESFRSAVYPGHPYGQLNPTEQEVEGYTLGDAKSFYAEQYGAAKAHLYIVGQFNAPAMEKTAEEVFSTWEKGESAVRNVPEIHGKKSLHVIDRPDAPQSTIYMGVPAPAPTDDEFIKFSLMNTVLGGSFGSRITTNIREDKGYTYSPRSFVWNQYKTGYWVERADVTTEFTGASLKEIFYEIDRLQNELLTDEELQALKNYSIGIHVLRNSSRTGVINQIETVNYHELDRKTLDEYVDKVVAATASDIQTMARKYLGKDKMTIVIVGDEAQITDQLKPYAD